MGKGGPKQDRSLSSVTEKVPCTKRIPLSRHPPDDAILWRYMDFPKFVSFLESSSLFFARADQLGDPFEGSYSQVNFNTLTEKYPAEVAEGLRKAMPGLARLRTNHFVNCWHWNDNESDAMRKIYSEKKRGYCRQNRFRVPVAKFHWRNQGPRGQGPVRGLRSKHDPRGECLLRVPAQTQPFRSRAGGACHSDDQSEERQYCIGNQLRGRLVGPGSHGGRFASRSNMDRPVGRSGLCKIRPTSSCQGFNIG